MSEELNPASLAVGGGGVGGLWLLKTVVEKYFRREEQAETAASARLSEVATKLENACIKLAQVAEQLAAGAATTASLEQRINKGLENHGKRIHDLEMGQARSEGRQAALEERAAQEPA